MSVVSIEHAMEHLYADPADQAQVERKLNAAIEIAERYMGRRIYADKQTLSDARVAATSELTNVVQISSTAFYAGTDLTLQMIDELNQEQKHLLMMQIRGIEINPAIEEAILLILGTLYAHREDVIVGDSATMLPISAEHRLEQYRSPMGI